MFNYINGKTISFKGSILGFKDLDLFEFETIDEKGPFAYLKSIEEKSIGFVVANPFTFFQNYSFELDEKDKTWLQINTHEEVLALGIITLKTPFEKSTMNLAAPLVININHLSGSQIVHAPSRDFSTQTPLFPKFNEKGIEGVTC
ncbi:flagellar assembly factor FliW [Paenibacillus sp. V4I9]|uniref:flagellar assembly protein FliW n=1 Tax=Paenibacillus sp. V4I9 TaxID=3042308 RepID=UPI00277EE4F4|nr:flagellar assembly protein FliW [Paenibacillus sp. V4I9]MDQ0891969.1 flagellar assembly factor FliW [Paenibacillus sp. V4I9]